MPQPPGRVLPEILARLSLNVHNLGHAFSLLKTLVPASLEKRSTPAQMKSLLTEVSS
jgi:hypothetical protein